MWVKTDCAIAVEGDPEVGVESVGHP